MIRQSEIIGQKLKFIFDVEETTEHVLPKEQFVYYIFVKNISGVNIENFKIKVINEDGVHFINPTEDSPITLKPNESKLYTMIGWCIDPKIYTVHFIGYGDNTEIMYDTLKIKCSLTNYQEELVHKLHIYDFSPYESIYSLEAEDYSQQVAQIFKRQKLPYRTGQQPFPMNEQKDEEIPNNIKEDLSNRDDLSLSVIEESLAKPYKNWFEENIESQSFIDQYKQIGNCDEHHYHYISRENFSEEAIESFDGKNLQELVDNINEKSEYFQAKFIKSGSNELLNDINQYAPNGFIYRMGLLSSELYHTLGIIPEFDYMGDYLFRWAPSNHQLPNLYPKIKGMKWGENLWAGKGWNVFKDTTLEYRETDEYKTKFEEGKIENHEFLETFEDKKTAEKYVDNLLYVDNIIRAQERSDLIKYKYTIEESYLDNGVFFINIPLAKIPSNFIVPDTEELYKIINRVKPFGSKPLLRYQINDVFSHDFDFYVKPKYQKEYYFDVYEGFEEIYKVSSRKIKYNKITCRGREIDAINEIEDRVFFQDSENNYLDNEIDFNVSNEYYIKNIFDKIKNEEEDLSEIVMEQTSPSAYVLQVDNSLITLEDILETLYQKNNNNISFYLKTELVNYEVNDNKNSNMIEISIDKESDTIISFDDDYNVTHNLKCSYNNFYKMQSITNFTQKNSREYVIKHGLENISSIFLYQNDFLNRKIIVWLAKDTTGKVHYFNHEIMKLDNDINIVIKKQKDGVDIKAPQQLYSCHSNPIAFETPFFYSQEVITPVIEKEETNWENLYRINNHENTYAFVNNLQRNPITPDDIEYLFNDINISETAKIESVCLDLKSASKNKNIYLYDAINTNYLDSEAKSHFISLEPTHFEAYSYNYESPSYYEEKLQEYINENNETLIKKYSELKEKSSLFNEGINLIPKNSNYMKDPDDYISIKKTFWTEISNFTDERYKLNETQSINFVIEGYNTGDEVSIVTQTLSGTNFAEQTREETIPSGYFRKKIDLYYPNSFQTDLFKVRFKFNNLNHLIKIFDTRINIEFKQAQDKDIKWDFVKLVDSNGENTSLLLQNLNNPYDINNGLGIKLSFDDLIRGEYYHLNTMTLYILYKETEMEMLINKNKYNYVSNNTSINTISGTSSGYPSVEFYNDITTMTQPYSNIGPNNNGVKLKKSLYQCFSTRDDNITNIEIFPNGMVGNPDENLKIGLYENHEHSPGRLIKEVYINGWLKNNSELKNLPSIKYNINVDDLKVNELYWFKIEIINPQENSYYLLKSIDEAQIDCKLLINENNNYINSFSSLQFNIYSKNLSTSFSSIPCLQTIFDNPYIKIGLHKSQGKIDDLRVNKELVILGEKNMSEVIEDTEEIFVKEVKVTRNTGNDEEVEYLVKEE